MAKTQRRLKMIQWRQEEWLRGRKSRRMPERRRREGGSSSSTLGEAKAGVGKRSMMEKEYWQKKEQNVLPGRGGVKAYKVQQAGASTGNKDCCGDREEHILERHHSRPLCLVPENMKVKFVLS